MCAGLRDATNLAWKLDLVLDGHAGPELLATYDEERRPSVGAAVDFSIELGKVICVPDPAEAAARDEAMASTYDGAVSEAPELPGIDGGFVAADAPLAGRLFPQAELADGWFDDVHGVGWRLVTVDPDGSAFDPELAGWFAGIGGAVVDVRDHAADLRAWFDAHGIRWALQRPDFHLFGAAADLAGAAALVAEVRRRSTPKETA
jgi:hypothetical protein